MSEKLKEFEIKVRNFCIRVRPQIHNIVIRMFYEDKMKKLIDEYEIHDHQYDLLAKKAADLDMKKKEVKIRMKHLIEKSPSHLKENLQRAKRIRTK